MIDPEAVRNAMLTLESAEVDAVRESSLYEAERYLDALRDEQGLPPSPDADRDARRFLDSFWAQVDAWLRSDSIESQYDPA